MSKLVPYLTLTNAEDTLRFLIEGLGFELVTEQRSDSGDVIHFEMTRGDLVIMGGGGDITPTGAPGLYLVVDEVESLFRRLIELGGSEIFSPEQTDWGTERARLTDPSGHEWTIGTYQPGHSWG